jgi:alpha,alpha-trehalase
MTIIPLSLDAEATSEPLATATAPDGPSAEVVAPPAATSLATYPGYQPSLDLGPLFHDVQLARLFPDSKTLVDARPRFAPADIAARYAAAIQAGPVDLRGFVLDNFEPPPESG